MPAARCSNIEPQACRLFRCGRPMAQNRLVCLPETRELLKLVLSTRVPQAGFQRGKELEVQPIGPRPHGKLIEAAFAAM